ncbi:MAG: TonB family protein [Steroidobacteraceae bacterium]
MSPRLTLSSSMVTVLFAVFAVTVRAEETVAARLPLPQLTVDLSSVTYPGPAQRAGMQGRVLVAFNITRRGRPDELEVVNAEPADVFDSVAIRAVKQVEFTVPRDWEATGGASHRFQFSVLFKLNPCEAPACIPPVPYESADDFLIVGAQAK